MARKSPCKWLSRDETGRPSCVHGPAHRQSKGWSCVESRRESGRKYREENLEVVRSRLSKYREDNRDILRERSRKYREDNRDILRERSRKYYAANLEKRRALSARQVRLRVGGIQVYLGHAPTAEAAAYFKNKIRTEAP